jgi:hypothetical protein
MAKNNEDFLKILATNVTIQYPRLNTTYRYNAQKKVSEPCAATASNAAWSLTFEMTKEQAKPLYEQLRAHYDASKARNTSLPAFGKIFGMKKVKDEHGNETGTIQFSAKRNAVRGDGIMSKPPMVIDGQKQPIADLAFWGGTKGVVRAYACAVEAEGVGGISLLLDAVQLTEPPRYGDGGLGDFETVESKADPFGDEKKPLAEEKRQSIKEELGDDIPW